MAGPELSDLISVEGADRHLDALRRNRRHGLGLRSQVLLTLAAILLVTVMLIGLVVLYTGERNLVQQKAKGGVAAAEVLAQTLAAGLAPGEPLNSEWNKAHLQRVASLNTERAGLSQIVIVDRDLSIIAAVPSIKGQSGALSPSVEHAMVMGEDKPLWEIGQAESGGHRELVILTPLKDARGAPLGVLGVRMTMRDVDAQISASQRLLVLYTTLDALALLLVGYFLLTRLIVRPIEAIGKATRRVAQGDYSGRVEVRPSNELGALAEDFNAMLRQLERHRQELETRVEELQHANEDLARAQSSLVRSEKLATVGQLAAGVAHEIGNPLSAVLGYIELMRDGDLDSETNADLLRRVDADLHRIDTTVRDLLDYSRAENETSACDLGQIVRSSLDLVEAQPRFRGIKVEVSVAEGLGLIQGSESRMQQVLVNLLLNAADAMDGEGTIALRVRTDGECIAVEVEDDGPGIDPEIAAQIFDPFFTTKPPGEGTGLGLAISHSIVASLGGALEVDRAQDGGALFTIRLPVGYTHDSKAES